jgi:23S rRNA (guanine2445-N2)-methyltransferase / 23S rRNA (guanine2069-N7)-methyltransferase
MGGPQEVSAIYRAMPDVFRRLKTWSFYILTAQSEFEAIVGQAAHRRRKLYNGRIECTYYQFYGPKPDALRRNPAPLPQAPPGDLPPADRARLARPSPPAFGGLSAKALEQAEIFRARLSKRARHLRRWPTKMGITCYRLYEKDIPEVPLVVDRYEDCLHIAEFERPTGHTPAEHGDWLDLMKQTAAGVLEIPLENVFLKGRRQRGTARCEPIGSPQRTIVAREGGLRFEINLSDYLDTGLSLDHRITRSMVRDLAAGKRLLNLFARTGAFSVYAAAGGATSTVSVEASDTYLQWAQRNMALNGLTGREHQFLRHDALGFLRSGGRRGAFDLAVVDPPTFSNRKTPEDSWDPQRDHAELLNRLAALMAPHGIIFFSTTSRRFKLAEAELRGLTVREISRQTVPPDFRNRRIHRAWRMTLMQ